MGANCDFLSSHDMLYPTRWLFAGFKGGEPALAGECFSEKGAVTIFDVIIYGIKAGTDRRHAFAGPMLPGGAGSGGSGNGGRGSSGSKMSAVRSGRRVGRPRASR